MSNGNPWNRASVDRQLVRALQHWFVLTSSAITFTPNNIFYGTDTDVIIWEGDAADPTRKPPEMYQLIENFCLGMRRLELFGRYHSLRPGWVTVTADELNLSPEEAREKDGAVPFDREKCDAQLKEQANGGKFVVPNTAGE